MMKAFHPRRQAKLKHFTSQFNNFQPRRKSRALWLVPASRHGLYYSASLFASLSLSLSLSLSPVGEYSAWCFFVQNFVGQPLAQTQALSTFLNIIATQEPASGPVPLRTGQQQTAQQQPSQKRQTAQLHFFTQSFLCLKKKICVETMKRYTFFCHCSTHNSPVASQIKTQHSVVASGAVSASACPHDASQLFMCCTPFRLICYNSMQCWPETDFVRGGLNSLSHRDDSSSKGASLREKVRLFGWRLPN